MEDFYGYWQGVRPRAHVECLRIVGRDDAPDVCAQVREACKSKLRDEWTEQQRWAYIRKACYSKSLRWIAERKRTATVEAEYLRHTEQTQIFISSDSEIESSMIERVQEMLSSNILSEEEMRILDYLKDKRKLADIAVLMGYSLSTLKRRMRIAIEKAKNFLRNSDLE